MEAQAPGKMNLDFSPEVMAASDNEDARREDIEKLEFRRDALSRLTAAQISPHNRARPRGLKSGDSPTR